MHMGGTIYDMHIICIHVFIKIMSYDNDIMYFPPQILVEISGLSTE